MTDGMLSPYLVLDFTDQRGEIGPMLLGDLGADVIRVETAAGSDARRTPPFDDNAPDDMRSLTFQAFNRNKRSIVVDPGTDRAAIESLIARADILIESGDLLSRVFGIIDAIALNDRLVHVRLTPFGNDGPHAHLAANDLTIVAMGGPVAVQGLPERAPIRISVPQVWRHAGTEAATAAMVALTNQRRAGKPQFVDLSAQCVMTWTMLNAMDAHAIQGFDFERLGSAISQAIGTTQLVHPTSDGHVVAIPMANVLRGCTEAMIEDGVVDASFRDMDWATFEANLAAQEELPISIAECLALSRAFFARHTRRELLELGLANECTLAPVNTLDELLAMDHMKVREYWRDLELVSGQHVTAAGAWAKPSCMSLDTRLPPPRLGEHSDEIRASLDTSREREPLAPDGKLPFDGVRVADFAWVGVGPISAKCLADHGATVVRVETEGRPDVLRGGMPFKDNERGWNRSQFFGDFNTSKKSLTLDMKSPQGMELARQLIAESDVFIESFAPGAIMRMGLDYESVRKLNPGIIMISTCLMGQTGPAAELAGYGYHAAAIAGFYEVTGYPDSPPLAPWVAYTDTIAPRFVSLLLASALDHRRRTGEGCFIDVAQIETALHFLSPEILDLQVNGHSATRLENRSRFYAPQGVYRCEGEDNWCAVAIEENADWLPLCRIIGRNDWAEDEGLATHEGRLARHDEIDAGLTEWTRQRSREDVMTTLQAGGVPAAVVQRSSDLLNDPQYEHRRFYRYMDHPEMGHIPYAGHQWKVSGYDNGPRSPAPCIGEHSFEVLGEIMGLTDEEIAEAYGSGAIA